MESVSKNVQKGATLTLVFAYLAKTAAVYVKAKTHVKSAQIQNNW
jgi:hypothetical protein